MTRRKVSADEIPIGARFKSYAFEFEGNTRVKLTDDLYCYADQEAEVRAVLARFPANPFRSDESASALSTDEKLCAILWLADIKNFTDSRTGITRTTRWWRLLPQAARELPNEDDDDMAGRIPTLVVLTRIEGEFVDVLRVAPPMHISTETKVRLVDAIENAILEGLKGKASRDRAYQDKVKDHLLQMSFPPSLFRVSRRKYLDEATALAQAVAKQAGFGVLTQDYDALTRMLTPCVETFEIPKPRGGRS